jgi:hypothetical protein
MLLDRVWAGGKFFRAGGQKFYVKGFSYGPFESAEKVGSSG